MSSKKREKEDAAKKAAHDLRRARRKAWDKMFPRESKTQNIPSRLLWKGMPDENSGDPLQLVGMEQVLYWYKSLEEARERRNESPVSSMIFHGFLGSFPHQTNPKAAIYDYAVELLELVDTDSDYGSLRTRQPYAGKGLDVTGAVALRQMRLRVFVGQPTEEERRIFKSYAGVSMANFTLLLPPIPIRFDSEISPNGEPLHLESALIHDELGSLELDRIFDVGFEIADWLNSQVENVKKRKRRKAELEKQLPPLKERAEKCEAEVALAKERLAQLEEQLQSAQTTKDQSEQVLKTAARELNEETNRARTALANLRAEEGRLRGVYREKWEALVTAIRLHGTNSNEYAAAQAPVIKADAERRALPARIKEAEQELARLESAARGKIRVVSGQSQLSEQALKKLQFELEQAQGAHRKAEAEMLEAKTKRNSVIHLLDDFSQS